MNSYTRREFLKMMGYGTATFSLPAFLSHYQSSAVRPNVLFIAVDDLNDWVNCLGVRPGVYTPNLDRLAKMGVLFTNAHCPAPICNPSRTSILSGFRPSTSGVYLLTDHWRNSPLLKEAVMLPMHFKNHGYYTLGGGKIFHCLSWIRKDYGVDENDFSIWDNYFPSKERSLADSVWPESAEMDVEGTIKWTPVVGAGTEGRPPYYFDWGTLEESADKKYEDTQLIDWATKQLEKTYDKPFFLAVGFFRPHIPWFVPKKYFDLYPIEQISLPPVKENDLDDCPLVARGLVRTSWHKWILQQGLWKQAIQAYLASISFMDAQLGRLLDSLEKSPYKKKTVIVLWSDNGMHIGEKEHWEKTTLWEKSSHVPLIFVVPGLTKAGARCKQAVSLLDIYPTLIDICGLSKKRELEGESLMSLLKNPTLKRSTPAIITQHENNKNNHAVRNERWRYIRYFDGSEELYDHDNDPNEFINLAGNKEYDSIKKEMTEWLPKVNVDRVK
jgi:arylsulfatase A-like enzyme